MTTITYTALKNAVKTAKAKCEDDLYQGGITWEQSSYRAKLVEFIDTVKWMTQGVLYKKWPNWEENIPHIEKIGIDFYTTYDIRIFRIEFTGKPEINCMDLDGNIYRTDKI